MTARVIFAGPSIFGATLDLSGIELRPPVEQGAIETAINEGAEVIGIVDGHYGQVGAVWHKELLLALHSDVAIYGSSSMGALRAAECAAFGMIPVGEIAMRYCRGELFDDADVALLNATAEHGYQPLTEPLVNALATIGTLLHEGLLSREEASVLEDTARALFFADRTAEAIVLRARLGARGTAILDHYRRYHVDLKAHDAALLVEAVRDHRSVSAQRPDWNLASSPFWRNRPRSSSETAQ